MNKQTEQVIETMRLVLKHAEITPGARETLNGSLDYIRHEIDTLTDLLTEARNALAITMVEAVKVGVDVENIALQYRGLGKRLTDALRERVAGVNLKLTITGVHQ